MTYDEYKIEEPKLGLKKNLILLAGLLLVAVLVVGIYYFTKVNRAATSESHEIQFTISKGMSTRQTAIALVEKKVIGNKTVFIIYSILHRVGDKIQAGEYSLNSNMTIAEIVDILTHGQVTPNTQRVTFVEGWSLWNLKDRKIFTPEELELGIVALANDNDFKFKFDESMGRPYNAGKNYWQGFLFPDTYHLSKDAKAEDLIAKMLRNFELKLTDQMFSDIEKQKRNLIDVITLASIIEKEVGRNKENISATDISTMQKERKLVASVFYNRLDIGMGLESDATVNYITGKSDRSVSIEDTKIKSPYNTYQVRGLPPTPISNPGLDSIMAAIYPTESDYLYFLNATEGTAYFAKTLDEHNENKAKYLR